LDIGLRLALQRAHDGKTCGEVEDRRGDILGGLARKCTVKTEKETRDVGLALARKVVMENFGAPSKAPKQ